MFVRTTRLIAGLALITCFLTGLAYSQARPKAPNFKLKSINGEVVELAKLKGRVVVVNFWATWCGPCRAEIPGFLEIYKTYKSKGLEIVGIALDESGWDVVKPFIQTYRIAYPVVLGDSKVARDYGGIQAIPTTFVIDRKGDVVGGQQGLLQKAQLEKVIKGLL
jgi:thiol-disulfide isomerase/thioredoxin